jgi:CRISPR/Cas system-associated endonuclease Cas3-HD
LSLDREKVRVIKQERDQSDNRVAEYQKLIEILEKEKQLFESESTQLKRDMLRLRQDKQDQRDEYVD